MVTFDSFNVSLLNKKTNSKFLNCKLHPLSNHTREPVEFHKQQYAVSELKQIRQRQQQQFRSSILTQDPQTASPP